MRKILNKDLLISIVWINEFVLSKEYCKVNVLCIEQNIEVTYEIDFKGILYSKFWQKNLDDEFEVIDTVLEEFSDSKVVGFVHSKVKEGYWAIEFMSGLHDLIIVFNSASLTKRI